MSAMTAEWERTQHGARPRWLTNVLRGLAVVVGVAAGLAVLAIGGLFAAITGCSGAMEEASSTLCTEFSWLVGPLEWTLVGAGALVPIVGGITTCVTGRPRWVGAGILAGAVLLGLVTAVAGAQESLLS